MKTPKVSGALRRAPDPTPRYARFARPTLLRYVGKIGRTQAGAPLDQILDPLLYDTSTVADPGFPVGGADLVEGAPTPEAATFKKICMSKQKNLDP